MFGRKGQGAMEYLMTYGWAILVVMIVGIVMWQLGIFSMGTTTVTATGFSKIKPQLAGTGLTAGGGFTGVFTNGVGTSINVDTAASTVTDILTNATCSGGVTLAQGTNPITAGSNFVLTSSGCSTGTAGDVYSIRVRVNYSVTIGTVSTDHMETGTVRGPRE
ncbi:hypothetical protein ACFLRF_01850 [Candidatus Altiarchaeota archaeon]